MPLEILVLRDPRESKRKCSLTPIREHPHVRFASYHPERRLAADGHVLLHPEGELLTEGDAGKPLLLVDCAWRRLPRLLATVDGVTLRRRLPPLVSAYPRRSSTFPDPSAGLASIEALYAASVILGEPDPDLLAGYHWRDEFLELNRELGGAPRHRGSSRGSSNPAETASV